MKLRRRVLLSMFSVVAISGGIAALIGAYLLWQGLAREGENRVKQDLHAARAFYDQRLEAMATALEYTALGEGFIKAVAAGDLDFLTLRLDAVRKNASVDLLYVTDARGGVIHRAHRPGVRGDSAAGDPLVALVLNGGPAINGTMLVPVRMLEREDPSLARRAKVPILRTPKARPSDKAELDQAMMLSAAVPVRGPQGAVVGVLRAGALLSRNHELVDRVQNTVFRDERYRGKPLGTATIFQDDVRISTNVLREDGTRAIGTRVSAEVYDRVLRQGKVWLGRAWVVNDWYISAYAPIHDVDNKPIGMLYVGVLQRKYDDVALVTMLTLSLVALGGLLAAGAVAWRLANSISRPVHALARASQAIAKGEFSPTVSTGGLGQHPPNEIAALSRTFSEMARSLRERDELLKQRTRLQLTRSERLAAVGRLAAGIAHEINNPLTGVLTFSHMLLREARENSQQREDVEAIIEAATRCRDIIRGLLNFARQNEPHKTLSDLNDVLRQAVNLTRNQALLGQVEVVEELAADLPGLVIDPYQVQEVAVNAILNAIDAMDAGGTLTVRTRLVEEDDGRPWAEFEITDTGCGISEEDLRQIFDPFFTTKPPGEGTGLGLAISYGIVTEHGGEIHVASRVNQGTTVTVRLPVAAEKGSNEAESTNPRGG